MLVLSETWLAPCPNQSPSQYSFSLRLLLASEVNRKEQLLTVCLPLEKRGPLVTSLAQVQAESLQRAAFPPYFPLR